MNTEMLEVKRQLLKLKREEFASFEKERAARIQEIARLREEVGEPDTALDELKALIAGVVMEVKAENNHAK